MTVLEAVAVRRVGAIPIRPTKHNKQLQLLTITHDQIGENTGIGDLAHLVEQLNGI